MDIVYTYIDSTDPKWIHDFNITNNILTYNNEHEFNDNYNNILLINNDELPDSKTKNRFNSELNELYYSIKSITSIINSYLIKNVFIVVSSLSQIELNKKYDEIKNICNDKLIIIEHKDIIPNKFLPTFNSLAIEIYLHNIKNLRIFSYILMMI